MNDPKIAEGNKVTNNCTVIRGASVNDNAKSLLSLRQSFAPTRGVDERTKMEAVTSPHHLTNHLKCKEVVQKGENTWKALWSNAVPFRK